MPRVCTVCRHEKREAIDAALVEGVTAISGIAALFRVSEDALQRHKAGHLPATLAKAQEAREVTTADSLLGDLVRLRDRAYTLLEKAEKGNDIRTALSGIREARECLALMGRIAGELKDAPTVNIALVHNPEWRAIVATLLQALEPFPEARIAAARALRDAGAHDAAV